MDFPSISIACEVRIGESVAGHRVKVGIRVFPSISNLLDPDSPDEMAFGQLRAQISPVKSNSYAGSSSRIPTDPTGERRNWQFRQRFRGLRSCRPNPSGEPGLDGIV